SGRSLSAMPKARPWQSWPAEYEVGEATIFRALQGPLSVRPREAQAARQNLIYNGGPPSSGPFRCAIREAVVCTRIIRSAAAALNAALAMQTAFTASLLSTLSEKGLFTPDEMRALLEIALAQFWSLRGRRMWFDERVAFRLPSC